MHMVKKRQLSVRLFDNDTPIVYQRTITKINLIYHRKYKIKVETENTDPNSIQFLAQRAYTSENPTVENESAVRTSTAACKL